MIAIYILGRSEIILECSQVLFIAALQPRLRLAVAQAKYCNSFQLTHMPRGNHAQSIASNGDQKEDKTLLQDSQLSQHGEFRHVSVSERQRSRPCCQNLCGAFERLYWQPTSKRAIEQWRPTAQQKRLYLHHQGEFQHQNCTVGTVHDSDHEGVVRIFVRHPYHSNELFILYYYIGLDYIIIILRGTIFPLPGV